MAITKLQFERIQEEYANVCAGAFHDAERREAPKEPAAYKWRVLVGDTTGRPFVKVGCPKCRQDYTFLMPENQSKVNWKTFQFVHCGKTEYMPVEVFEQFCKIQVAINERAAADSPRGAEDKVFSYGPRGRDVIIPVL